MPTTRELLDACLSGASTRFDAWIRFVNATRAENVLELGVLRGNFAEGLLRQCASIRRYYMVDPWRHLDGWNKPANKDDDTFNRSFAEAMDKTAFAADKRIVLRGKTTEVSNQVPDGEVDFAYVDGDHTLRGITIDLVRLFPKIRDGGWLGGDDFTTSVWQHAPTYEPTLVFPFAVHFAEAVNAPIYALPHSQFLIEKNSRRSFEFVDLTGSYGGTSLIEQFHPDSQVFRAAFPAR